MRRTHAMSIKFTNYDYTVCSDMDQIGEPPRTQNLEGFDLLFGTTEFFGGVLVVLVTVWLTHFRGGFAWHSDPGLEFNWHPLLMTIGLVFLYANGMLIYRSQRMRRKKSLKLIHGGTMIFVIVLTIVALIAVFDSHNLKSPPTPNMYSLHSWVGMTSVILFCCQWVAGFTSFFFPGIKGPLRASYLPIHVYFGTAGFVGVIASCLIGLNEKAIFTEAVQYSSLTGEAVLINIIGLFFVIFGGLVVYLVSQQRYKREGIPEDSDLIPAGGN